MSQYDLLYTVFACVITEWHLVGFQAVLDCKSLHRIGWLKKTLASVWRTSASFRCLLNKADFINNKLPAIVSMSRDEPALMNQIVKRGSGLARVVDDPAFLPAIVAMFELTLHW